MLLHIARPRECRADDGRRSGSATRRATGRLLSTLELAAIKTGAGARRSTLWQQADEAGAAAHARRATMPRIDAARIDIARFTGNPLHIDASNGIASAADLVRAMDWLRRNGDDTRSAILAINSGLGPQLRGELRLCRLQGRLGAGRAQPDLAGPQPRRRLACRHRQLEQSGRAASRKRQADRASLVAGDSALRASTVLILLLLRWPVANRSLLIAVRRPVMTARTFGRKGRRATPAMASAPRQRVPRFRSALPPARAAMRIETPGARPHSAGVGFAGAIDACATNIGRRRLSALVLLRRAQRAIASTSRYPSSAAISDRPAGSSAAMIGRCRFRFLPAFGLAGLQLIWMIGDAFVIPSLCRSCRRTRAAERDRVRLCLIIPPGPSPEERLSLSPPGRRAESGDDDREADPSAAIMK